MANAGKATSVLQFAVLLSGIGAVVLMIGIASIAHLIRGGTLVGAITVVVAVGMLAYAGCHFLSYRHLLRRTARGTPLATDDVLGWSGRAGLARKGSE